MSTPERGDAAGAGAGVAPALAVATLGGVGLVRAAPGTWGSIVVAIPAGAWLCSAPSASLAQQALLWGALALVALALAAVPPACRSFGRTDPPAVVIDEGAGLLLGLGLLPGPLLTRHPVLAVVAVLVLFRLLDIAKPWPLPVLERFPGALGILADDLAAGLLAGAVTAVVLG